MKRQLRKQLDCWSITYESYTNCRIQSYRIEILNSCLSSERQYAKCWKLMLNSRSRFILRRMIKVRLQIKKWSNIFEVIAIISKTINQNDYLWRNSLQMQSRRHSRNCSSSWSTMNLNHEWVLIFLTKSSINYWLKNDYWHKRQRSSLKKWKTSEISSKRS